LDWFDRLIKERKELSSKLEKLKDFMKDPGFELLTHEEQTLLQTQSYAMSVYLCILEFRINRYTT
jgi:hypothetical protein